MNRIFKGKLLVAIALAYIGFFSPCEAAVANPAQTLPEQKQVQPTSIGMRGEQVEAAFDQNYYKVIFNHVVRTAPGMGGDRAASITTCILDKSKKYQVEPFLATALFTQESGFSMAALSRTGAIGIAQLQPETAQVLGVNPYDMEQNIEGGIRYLSDQLAAFKNYGGDVTLINAIAAYNAGPNAVNKYGGVPPYRETTHHVKRVGAVFRQLRIDYDCVSNGI